MKFIVPVLCALLLLSCELPSRGGAASSPGANLGGADGGLEVAVSFPEDGAPGPASRALAAGTDRVVLTAQRDGVLPRSFPLRWEAAYGAWRGRLSLDGALWAVKGEAFDSAGDLLYSGSATVDPRSSATLILPLIRSTAGLRFRYAYAPLTGLSTLPALADTITATAQRQGDAAARTRSWTVPAAGLSADGSVSFFLLGLAPGTWTVSLSGAISGLEYWRTSSNQIAIADGEIALRSPVFSASRMTPPIILPGARGFEEGSRLNVTIEAGTDAIIRYTVDGSVPGPNTLLYSANDPGPFLSNLSSAVTVKAIAIDQWGTLPSSAVASADFFPRVKAPTADVASGSYAGAQTLSLSCATAGATIRYSTDGSDPSTGLTYSAPLGVAASTSFRVVAVKAGLSPSEERTFKYTIGASPQLDAPALSVAAGTISSDARLTITGPAGAAIRYTLDGSTPSASNGSAYAAPIPIDRSMTVKAYCSQAGFVDSPMAIAAYTVKLPPVVFSIPGGDYYGPQTLRLSCAVSGSEISYQINGGVSQAYSGPISLTAASTNVQAYATKANCTPQDSYSSAIYSIKTPPPVVDLRSGTFRAEQDVRVSPRRAGLSVIYTLDGSSPAAANSTTATTITEAATVHIEKTRTFRAISRSAVSGDSEELSFTYELKVPEPRASLPPGSYPPSETLSLSDAVDGATIKYSLDAATVPSATTGTQYSAALPLYKAQSIKAMAYKAGWTPSDLVSFDYAFRGDIVDVAAGSTFVLYLRRDGSLWYRGKLGESSSNYRASKLADGVARFWASESFCLWVTKDGQLYGQGDNTYGQLGQGRTGYVYQGSQILGDVVDVALGVQYAMAVKKDGSLWAWGYNWGYRMGIPGATSSDTVLSPRLIMASGAKAVAAGHDHSLVLKSDGSLWGCGYNGSSQLTSSFPSNQRTHVQLVAANVAAVYAGPDQSYYLEKVADGFDLHAVGGNGSYMIGNYSSGNVNYFTILGLELASMPKSFSAAKSENLALLVTGEGKLYGWGSSNAGAFGLGDWNTHQSPTPLREGVVAAAAGNNCSLYVSAEGALWGMGRNSNYELGDASNEGYGVKYGSNANVPALIAW